MERRLIDGQRRRDFAQQAEEQPERAQAQRVGLEGRARAGERRHLHLHEERSESGIHQGIGDLLRAERLRRGEDLDDVAARLRLQPEQLRAIEDGAYDVLPGTTYAIGFVRSYAGYLGLDAQEAVERFKRETQGTPAPSALAFPEPSREARVPRGWMVLLAIGIVGVLYAGWYYGSAEQADLGQSRSADPGEVVPFPGAGPTEDEDAQSVAAEPELELGPELTVPEASPPPAEAERAAPPAASLADAPLADAPLADAPPPDAPSASLPATPGDAPAEGTPSASVGEAVADDPWGSTWPEPADAAEGGARASAAAEEDSATAGPALLLRAHGETWVQVEGSEGDILLSRILRAGDEYAVPDQAGLSLTTGNAGALEIVVDGQPTGMIGGIGKVRRDIALDDMRPR